MIYMISFSITIKIHMKNLSYSYYCLYVIMIVYLLMFGCYYDVIFVSLKMVGFRMSHYYHHLISY